MSNSGNIYTMYISRRDKPGIVLLRLWRDDLVDTFPQQKYAWESES